MAAATKRQRRPRKREDRITPPSEEELAAQIKERRSEKEHSCREEIMAVLAKHQCDVVGHVVLHQLLQAPQFNWGVQWVGPKQRSE